MFVKKMILKDIEVWDADKVCPARGGCKCLDVEDHLEPENLGGCFIIFWFVVVEAITLAFYYSYN